MLLGSKHTSDPSSDARSSPLMRSSRATRSRSKLTRCSQSTPIKPNVLPIARHLLGPRKQISLTLLPTRSIVGSTSAERKKGKLGRMAVEAALGVIDRHFAAENAHEVEATLSTYTED